MSNIHPTAIVDSSAEIADDVTIGPYSTVEAEVRVDAGCRIGAYVTLGERLVLGRRVRVFNYACLGTASQDRKHQGERSHAEIGEDSIVREFVTVNRATKEGGVTRVGRRVLLMAYSHVAHECSVGDGAVLVNAVTLGGEVTVGAGATISGMACVHQFCRVGAHAFIGANSKVTLDIAPFIIADGHPARPYGPNVVGLRREGFTDPEIREIHRIYRTLFDRGTKFRDNLDTVLAQFGQSKFAEAIVQFCRASRRGIARPRPRPALNEGGSESRDEIESQALWV